MTYDSALVMAWLRDRVPITLLADLAANGGPLSREIFTSEAIEYDFAATLPEPRQASARTASRA